MWLDHWAQRIVIQVYKVQLVAGYLCPPSGVHAKPVVFNILTKDPEDELQCTLRKAVDGTNLGGGADALVGRAATDRALKKLKKHAVRNSVKSRHKRKVLHLGWRYSV